MLETPDFADADVPPTIHIIGIESACKKGFIEFPRALSRGPLRPKCRDKPIDFVEIHAVTTKIGSAARSVFHFATWNYFGNKCPQVREHGSSRRCGPR